MYVIFHLFPYFRMHAYRERTMPVHQHGRINVEKGRLSRKSRCCLWGGVTVLRGPVKSDEHCLLLRIFHSYQHTSVATCIVWCAGSSTAMTITSAGIAFHWSRTEAGQQHRHRRQSLAGDILINLIRLVFDLLTPHLASSHHDC